MKKDENLLTGSRFFWLTVLFMLASILNIGSGDMSKNGWLAYLISPLFALPMIFVWQTIAGAGGFSSVLGDKGGKILWGVYFVGSFIVCTFIFSVITYFAVNTSLEKTSRVLLYILPSAALLIISYSAMKGLGRLVRMLLPFNILLILAVLLPSVRDYDFSNLLPIAHEGIPALGNDIFTALSISLSSVAMPIMLSGNGKKDQTKYICLGYIAGALMLSFIFIKNLCILGWPAMSRYYFPSYAATSLINLGHFFQRLETITSVSYLICEMIKLAVCLLSACRAAREVTGRPLRYAPAVICTASALCSYFAADSVMELDRLAGIYRIAVTVPFIIIPLLIFIPAYFIKKKKAA